MRKCFIVTCPACGSNHVSAWYDEERVRYAIRCNECDYEESVLNIKFAEAFPEWFELFEVGTDD